jgi:hypothetical protein
MFLTVQIGNYKETHVRADLGVHNNYINSICTVRDLALCSFLSTCDGLSQDNFASELSKRCFKIFCQVAIIVCESCHKVHQDDIIFCQVATICDKLSQ